MINRANIPGGIHFKSRRSQKIADFASTIFGQPNHLPSIVRIVGLTASRGAGRIHQTTRPLLLSSECDPSPLSLNQHQRGKVEHGLLPLANDLAKKQAHDHSRRAKAGADVHECSHRDHCAEHISQSGNAKIKTRCTRGERDRRSNASHPAAKAVSRKCRPVYQMP